MYVLESCKNLVLFVKAWQKRERENEDLSESCSIDCELHNAVNIHTRSFMLLTKASLCLRKHVAYDSIGLPPIKLNSLVSKSKQVINKSQHRIWEYYHK